MANYFLNSEGKLPQVAKTDLATTFVHADQDWVSNYVQASYRPPAGDDVPTIAHAAGDATALTSPAVFKPSILGTGARIVDWDGKSDTNFLYASGSFHTDAGAVGDAALYGTLKPGTSVVRWPLMVSFVTSSTVVEIGFYAKTTNATPMFEVNGRLVTDTNIIRTATGYGFKTTLTFPTAKARTIQMIAVGEIGFMGVRLPTGGTLSKPAATEKRRIAIIGDSYVNGAGGAESNGGANCLETFAYRLARLMGADDPVLAGIGSTGWVAGSTQTEPNHYGSRLDMVLAMNPHVIVFYGSINDGGNGEGVQAAVEAALARCTAVPEVYVIGPLLNGYAVNNAAVKAGTLKAGRTFIDLGSFLYGQGRVDAPKGDGNRDFYLMSDGAHPTFTAHRAIAERIFRGIYTRNK